MTTPELLGFIRDSRAVGTLDDQIKQTLAAQGWTSGDIEEGFVAISKTVAAPGQSFFSKHPNAVRTSAGVFAVLVLLGLGAYFWAPTPTGLVMGRMMEKMSSVETFKYSGFVEGSVTAPDLMSTVIPSKSLDSTGSVAGSTDSKIRFDFTGSSNLKDLNNPDSEFSFTLSLQNLIFGVETKSIGDDLFFKLNQASDLGFLDLSKIKGVWIKTSYGDLNQFNSAEEEGIADELTVEQKSRLKEVVASSRPIQITAKLANESIDGKAVLRYQYQINKVEIRALILAISEVTQGVAMFDTDIQSFDRKFSGVNFSDGEVWVGKKDNYLYKLTGGITTTPALTQQGAGNLNWELNFSDFNLPLKLQPPAEFKTFNEVTALFGNAGAANSTQSRDAVRLAEIATLRVALELYYSDFGRYPQDLTDINPKYIPVAVSAPIPPDGTCTQEQNAYTYKYLSKDSYTLVFCLGLPTTNYAAGVRILDPQGIK